MYVGKTIEQRSDVASFIGTLNRALKTSVLYPPESKLPSEFRESCWVSLRKSLADMGLVNLEISRSEISFDGESVYSAQDEEISLASIIHRDGIRSLSFREGIPREEFDSVFAAILAVYARSEEYEDLANLLWEADLDFVDYEAVDNFTVTEMSLTSTIRPDDAGELQYNDIIAREQEDGDFSGLDLSELSSSTLELFSSSSMMMNLQRFKSEENDAIIELIRNDQQVSVEFAAIDLLFDIAHGEREKTEFLKTAETIDSVFNRLLEAEVFPLLVYLLGKLKKASDDVDAAVPHKAQRFLESYHRSGDRIRISHLTKILNRSEDQNLEPLQTYLEELDWSSLAQLVWMLGELKYYPARKAVCSILQEKGRKKPEIIAGAVYDSRWYVVRNAASILGEIATEKCVAPLKRASEHEDERVRWEAAAALGKINSRLADEVLITLLHDESARIRRTAARHIVRRRFEPAYGSILSMVKDKGFKFASPSEQKEFLNALAATGGSRAFSVLKKIAKRWTPFGKEACKSLKELAVHALALIEDDRVDSTLEGWARSSKRNLSEWARSALKRRSRDKLGREDS